jgi:squalene cyclase
MLEAAELATRLSSSHTAQERQLSLNVYNDGRVGAWRRLLDIDQNVISADPTADWLIEHRSSILGNLPASGQSLSQILEQLHLRETAA